ncbi:hypothetical protein EAX61_14895 [Dokdonia sinensis]|uniref:Carboxypeptidase-like regulatory domain-containing protein n=1 Tax=Dokdonia sinensis TaxID=2479847 RepID=A0A3M0FV36_9FLAO|nr:hypothetical protein [Dokdonia sinensis]RMB56368.1 hypothetical protein EAX61_14895 [Dokdonia sinensis]
MKQIILLFIILYGSFTYAQSDEVIELEGKVLNDTIDRSQLNVVNLSMRKGTATSLNGEFTIDARLGDTINISAVQYEPRQFVVNQTIFDRKRITIYLIPKVNELEEVEVSNIDLSGNLNRDAQSTKGKPNLYPEDLGLPKNTAPKRTVEERRYHTAVSSGGGIPLDGLINSITGRLKMLKKHIEVSRFEKQMVDNRQRFSDSLYMRELKIAPENIEDFVYYVFEDPKAKEFVDVDDTFGLLEFMMEKAPLYRELKSQE